MASTVSRSTVPVAGADSRSTHSPCRFSMEHMVREGERRLFAGILAVRQVSGSVVLYGSHWCTGRHVWKFTVGLPGSSGGAAGADSFFNVTLVNSNAHA